jgi:hypothetical protein
MFTRSPATSCSLATRPGRSQLPICRPSARCQRMRWVVHACTNLGFRILPFCSCKHFVASLSNAMLCCRKSLHRHPSKWRTWETAQWQPSGGGLPLIVLQNAVALCLSTCSA